MVEILATVETVETSLGSARERQSKQKGYFIYYKSPTPRPSQVSQPELREPIQSHKKALHYLDELCTPSPWLFP